MDGGGAQLGRRGRLMRARGAPLGGRSPTRGDLGLTTNAVTSREPVAIEGCVYPGGSDRSADRFGSGDPQRYKPKIVGQSPDRAREFLRSRKSKGFSTAGAGACGALAFSTIVVTR